MNIKTIEKNDDKTDLYYCNKLLTTYVSDLRREVRKLKQRVLTLESEKRS